MLGLALGLGVVVALEDLEAGLGTSEDVEQPLWRAAPGLRAAAGEHDRGRSDQGAHAGGIRDAKSVVGVRRGVQKSSRLDRLLQGRFPGQRHRHHFGAAGRGQVDDGGLPRPGDGLLRREGRRRRLRPSSRQHQPLAGRRSHGGPGGSAAGRREARGRADPRREVGNLVPARLQLRRTRRRTCSARWRWIDCCRSFGRSSSSWCWTRRRSSRWPTPGCWRRSATSWCYWPSGARRRARRFRWRWAC